MKKPWFLSIREIGNLDWSKDMEKARDGAFDVWAQKA